MPDSDRETLQQWITETRQSLDPKHRAAIARALEQEARIAEAIHHTLREQVTGDLGSFLDELRLGVDNARKRLRRVHEAGWDETQ